MSIKKDIDIFRKIIHFNLMAGEIVSQTLEFSSPNSFRVN